MPDLCWLAAEYFFPSTYSIRVPGSSMTNTKAMPAPGPGTIRLALIRVGIELYGDKFVRNALFQDICSAQLRIYPPESISISAQVLGIYKPGLNKFGKNHYQEGVSVREFAHAKGNMTVFIKISSSLLKPFETILSNIGYWGQANSLAFCHDVSCREPEDALSGLPIEQIKIEGGNNYSCFVTDFANPNIKWQEVVGPVFEMGRLSLKHELYVWPLRVCNQWGANTFLLRRTFLDG